MSVLEHGLSFWLFCCCLLYETYIIKHVIYLGTQAISFLVLLMCIEFRFLAQFKYKQ